MKTFLRWQGNKTKSISKIKKFIPEFTGTYIEPFLGSGALFLHLEPKEWIVGDLNKDLINMWLSAKNCPDEVTNKFKEFGEEFVGLSNKEKLELCRKTTSDLESSSYNFDRTINYMLMLHCNYQPSLIRKKFYFNGLYPKIRMGVYSFLKDTQYSKFEQVSLFLNSTSGQIIHSDYKELLKLAKRGDFVFLDPPYDGLFGFKYNDKESIGDTFLNELLEQVKLLDSKGISWIMTQIDNQKVREIFKDYTLTVFKVHRPIKKSYSDELLITKANTTC